MKKIIAIMTVAAMLALAACGGAAQGAPAGSQTAATQGAAGDAAGNAAGLGAGVSESCKDAAGNAVGSGAGVSESGKDAAGNAVGSGAGAAGGAADSAAGNGAEAPEGGSDAAGNAAGTAETEPGGAEAAEQERYVELPEGVEVLTASDKDGLRMLRWAEGAAMKTAGELGVGSCVVRVCGIDPLDLGMASAGTVTAAKSIELYRVSYIINYDPVLYGETAECFEEIADGWYRPSAKAPGPLFGVYAYSFKDLDYIACAGYFSEDDVRAPQPGEDRLMPYRELASGAMSSLEDQIERLSEYGMGPEYWGDFTVFDLEVMIGFDGSGVFYGPGLEDSEDMFDIASREEFAVDGGYGEDDKWYNFQYLGLGGEVRGIGYFRSISGRMTNVSLETDLPGARTPRGVRIGDSRADVEKAYPEMKHGTPPWRPDLGDDCYYYNHGVLGDPGQSDYFDGDMGANLVLQMKDGKVARICAFNISD